jgi:general secretion pathway protein A
MYLKHYNLKEKPFDISPNPRYLWLGEKHVEGFATLKYGITENKGFLLLTGDVGTGKTVLINRLINEIETEAVIAAIPDPGLENIDFFNILAVEFKMNKKFDSKGGFLIEFKNFLHKSANKKVLLIIDEAQRLNFELLEQIRLLSNIELHDRKLINIFFVGQTDFCNMLCDERSRAVSQRIAVRYHLEPLNREETDQYIRHRLEIAGRKKDIFSMDAVREIFSFSEGYPRLINIICDHALLTGYSDGLKVIGSKIIKECKKDLIISFDSEEDRLEIEEAGEKGEFLIPGTKLQNSEASNTRSPWKIIAIFSLISVSLITVGYLLFDFNSNDKPRWPVEDIASQQFQEPSIDRTEAKSDNLKEINETSGVEIIKESPKNSSTIAQLDQADPTIAEAKPETDKQEEPNNSSGSKPFKKSHKTNEIIAHTNKVEQPLKAEKQEASLNHIQKESSSLKQKVLIYFKHNSNELPTDAIDGLDEIVEVVSNYPESEISIEGYTDSSGDFSFNEQLSLFRANVVKIYLIAQGINSTRINALGMGQKNPIASNETLEGL